MRSSICFFIFSVVLGSWSGSAEAVSRDVTSEFRMVWNESTPFVPSSEVEILLVRGYAADVEIPYPGMGGSLRLTLAAGYMADQERFLKSNRVPNQLVPIDSGATCDENSRHIARAIRGAEKPVIIFTHSKGGPDLLHTMMNYPVLWPKVRGIVFMQSALMGTPLADGALSAPLGWFSRFFLQLLGGNPDSISDLSKDYRAQYYVEHAQAMVDLARRVSVLSFATWSQDFPGQMESILDPLRDYIRWQGSENDGMVPFESQVFPESEFVALEGPDHLIPVFDYQLASYDRQRLTRTLLTMAQRR